MLASDAEGNDFRNLSAVEPGFFAEEDNLMYEVDSEEYAEGDDDTRRICLWPV